MANKTTLRQTKKDFRVIASTEVFVLIFAFMIFLFFYLTDVNRPGAVYKLGYYEIWYDQSQYYDMVTGIVTKNNLGHFQYPLGYPMLGAIGYILYSKDPFLIINLIFFVLYTWLSYKISRKFFDEAISVISTLLISFLVVSMFSTPWTSTVTSVCFLYVIYIILYEKYDFMSFVYSGLAIGLSFATRIGDVIPTSIVFLFFIFEFMKNTKKANYILLTILISIFLISSTIFLNYTFSGFLLGNYMNSVMGVGFNIQAIVYKVYGYFFDSFTFSGEVHYLSMPLFKYCFLFILSPLGLYYLFFDKSTRKIAVLIILSFLSWFITYVPHGAISGLTLKYGTLHYLKMLFPLLLILSLKYIIHFSTEKNRSEISRNLKILFLYFTTLSLLLVSVVHLLNFSVIDMANAQVDASENNKTAFLAIDNNIDTRWDTAKPQSKSMFYAVYFDRAYLINHIKLYTIPSPSGYPRDFNILCSTDGVSWNPITSVTNVVGTSNMDIYFDPLSCKSLKLVLTKGDNDWWSIHELRVYGR